MDLPSTTHNLPRNQDDMGSITPGKPMENKAIYTAVRFFHVFSISSYRRVWGGEGIDPFRVLDHPISPRCSVGSRDLVVHANHPKREHRSRDEKDHSLAGHPKNTPWILAKLLPTDPGLTMVSWNLNTTTPIILWQGDWIPRDYQPWTWIKDDFEGDSLTHVGFPSAGWLLYFAQMYLHVFTL